MSIKKTREIIGLSQQHLAIFLGVSRSQVSMAERNRRSLPTAALIQLGRLENSIYNDTAAQQYPKKLANKNSAVLQAYVKDCLFEAAAAKIKLRSLQETYQKNIRLLCAAVHLQGMLPKNANSKKEKLLLEVLETQALKKLHHCGEAEQAKLQLKIQSLELEAAKAGDLAGKNAG